MTCMKVLFVCVANRNRSQIAEAIFNRLSKKNRAVSAGLTPIKTGPLRGVYNNPIEVMKEQGLDLSKAKVKKLSKRLADSAGKIVFLFNKRKHMKDIPEYLRGSPKVEVWSTNAIPDEVSYNEYCKRERKRIPMIKRRVKRLVDQIG